MKKRWRILPEFIRWLLVTLIILVIIGGFVAAFTALTGTGDITVEENLSFVGPSTFTVSLYPQESEVAQLTVANASSIDMDIDLASTVIPDPGTQGLTVDLPNNVTVPGSGQVVIDITITAGKSAEPQVYSVSIEIIR